MKVQRWTDSKTWPWPEASKFVSETSYFEPPSLFAKAMSETIPIEANKTRLLDIGCGSGIVGIYCLVEKKAQCVTFNDIQREAISESGSNVATKIEEGQIRPEQADYVVAPFSDIARSIVDHHSLIGFNPPQLPTDYLDEDYLRKLEVDPSMSIYRIGGTDGLKIVREFFHWYAGLSLPKPAAVILLSSFLGRTRIANAIRTCGLSGTILAETPAPLRKILINAADNFSAAERSERSLARSLTEGGSIWMKTFLTVSLTNA